MASAQDPARIAIFVDRPDWHARRLAAAFAARAVESRFVSMAACGFETGSGGLGGLKIPGFDADLPDAAFVRCLPGGSFEQVTLRLGLLHALRAAGLVVCNDARSIECCVDKSMTSYLLERAGLPTPKTWVVQSHERAAAIVDRWARPNQPLVAKPLFGSQGRGLRLVERPEDLPESDQIQGVYYLQGYVRSGQDGWEDQRVLVSGGRAIAAMKRRGVSWITNAHQGAHCTPCALDPDSAELAVAAGRAVGAHYAGVDIIRDSAGRAFVLEVNSMPAWSALQRVHDFDITQALVDALLDSVLKALASRRVQVGSARAEGAAAAS